MKKVNISGSTYCQSTDQLHPHRHHGETKKLSQMGNNIYAWNYPHQTSHLKGLETFEGLENLQMTELHVQYLHIYTVQFQKNWQN